MGPTDESVVHGSKARPQDLTSTDESLRPGSHESEGPRAGSADFPSMNERRGLARSAQSCLPIPIPTRRIP